MVIRQAHDGEFIEPFEPTPVVEPSVHYGAGIFHKQ